MRRREGRLSTAISGLWSPGFALILLLSMVGPASVIQATASQKALAAEVSSEATVFEVRLAAFEEREGWLERSDPRSGRPIYLAPEPALTQDDVERAWIDAVVPEPRVGVFLTTDGGVKATRFSHAHVGERTAFLVDGRIVSVVTIAAAFGRHLSVRGLSSASEAEGLVASLSPPLLVASGDDPEPVRFEIRLVDEERREGWLERTHPRLPEVVYVAPEAAVSGADVERAWFESFGTDPGVRLYLTEAGALRLALLTRQHRGEMIAFIVNDRILSMPRIREEITDGRAIIQGGLGEEDARALAAALGRR